MKNTTLRGLFAASLLLVSSNVFAQNNTASATAVIVQPIEISQNTDLNFGTLAAGFVKTVSTVGQASGTAAVTGDESAASFTLTKGANIPFTMSVTGLSLFKGELELPATFVVEAISDADNSSPTIFTTQPEGPSTRELVVAGGNNTNTDATTLTGTTSLKVRIGGTVSPVGGAEPQEPGTYSGTITLTAVYN